ncbi:MAG: chemotaxis protein [Granulosicoccus sp.]
MTDILESVDNRTNLAGTNRLEILMFSLGKKNQIENDTRFGINVFKVRELMTVPTLIKIPEANPSLVGMANIRGKAVPVIDLNHFCGYESSPDSNILIVTEFNNSTQGFMVSEVDDIIQLAWSQIVEPNELVSNSHDNMLTAMSKLEDDRILLLIDVEKIIAEVLATDHDFDVETVKHEDSDSKFVFFADDSGVARIQVGRLLENMNIRHHSANNGRDAWANLRGYADEAEQKNQKLRHTLQAIVTDVEMPYMDGYVLTQMIKEDPRFEGIPVMMHSSLSAEQNKKMGMKVGADAYVAKLVAKEFTETLNGLIAKNVAECDFKGQEAA